MSRIATPRTKATASRDTAYAERWVARIVRPDGLHWRQGQEGPLEIPEGQKAAPALLDIMGDNFAVFNWVNALWLVYNDRLRPRVTRAMRHLRQIFAARNFLASED